VLLRISAKAVALCANAHISRSRYGHPGGSDIEELLRLCNLVGEVDGAAGLGGAAGGVEDADDGYVGVE
jgi:hypothetical protein